MYTHTKQNAKDIYEIESKHTQGNIFILYKKGIYTYIIFRQGIELERRAYENIQIHSTDRNERKGYIFIHTK